MKRHKLMAILCQLSYIKQKNGNFDFLKLNKELPKLGLRIIKAYDRNGTQALFLGGDQFNVVVFRGSDELNDWKKNFSFYMTGGKDRVHSGFQSACNQVASYINYDIRAYGGNKPLYITGHSLGGAYATVLAHNFDKYSIPIKQVVTFGQPRVFGVQTARSFQSRNRHKFFRYHNNNDAVTMAPPWFFGYRHVGQIRYITTRKEVLNHISLWDRIKGAVCELGKKGFDAMEDHDIKDYIAAL